MADPIKNQLPEPEIVAEIKKEIGKLGDGFEANKKNYDELRKTYDALQAEIKASEGKFDALVQAKISKLTEDIATRQEAIDTKAAAMIEAEKVLNKRMDDIEVAAKRTPKSGMTHDEEVQEVKDAHQFQRDSYVVRQIDKGLKSYEELPEPNMDEYKAYSKAFPAFLRRDERLLVSTNPDHLKALSVGIDPDGGYTVKPAMSARIVKRLYEEDPIRQMAASESITTGALEWMVDYDQAGFGWEGETVAGAETDTPQFYKKRIPVHVMYAKPQASQTLLEDSGINIENWLADKVANRFMRGEGAAFVSGDGVGKPRGFLTYGNYTTAGVDEWAKIERTNMQAAAALTADGFIAVKYSLTEFYLNRCTWLMARGTVRSAMYLKDGEGNYLWKPSFAVDGNSTILSTPVRMSTSMPAVGAGLLAVAIADFREAYMIVDRLGITIQRDPFTRKPMVEFYTRKRVGGDVINYQAIKLGNIAV